MFSQRNYKHSIVINIFLYTLFILLSLIYFFLLFLYIIFFYFRFKFSSFVIFSFFPLSRKTDSFICIFFFCNVSVKGKSNNETTLFFHFVFCSCLFVIFIRLNTTMRHDRSLETELNQTRLPTAWHDEGPAIQKRNKPTNNILTN